MKYKIEADEKGFFGKFGGQFVPEKLMPVLKELEEEYKKLKKDEEFQKDFKRLLKDYVGRETPLTFAKNYTKKLGGAKIYLKREDLNHTGAHKIVNALGQALIAKKMGKTKIVAETGAGQHGVASATAAALLDLDLIVYMGREDTKRQSVNVFRMELLGAEVRAVDSGQGTLSDAVDEALHYWVENAEDTYYLLGSAVGPHPFPTIVRDFQSVIGEEIKKEILEKEGRLPDALVACIGGGSNAIGTFYPMLEDLEVQMFGVEAGGKGKDSLENCLALLQGTLRPLHGSQSYVITDEEGKVRPAYSISAGLDYPGVGPEHSFLKEKSRVEYTYATDEEAIQAMVNLSQLEGIIPALESSHALAYVEKLAPQMGKDEIIVVTVSGRGDKDMETVRNYLENNNI